MTTAPATAPNLAELPARPDTPGRLPGWAVSLALHALLLWLAATQLARLPSQSGCVSRRQTSVGMG